MPIVTYVDHAHGYVRSAAVGKISYADVKDHLAIERRFNGLVYPELIDGRGATISWSSEETREIVELLRNLGRESKLGATAVLVADDLSFGVLRMLQAMVEDFCEVQPFRLEPDALAWLTAQ